MRGNAQKQEQAGIPQKGTGRGGNKLRKTKAIGRLQKRNEQEHLVLKKSLQGSSILLKKTRKSNRLDAILLRSNRGLSIKNV